MGGTGTLLCSILYLTAINGYFVITFKDSLLKKIFLIMLAAGLVGFLAGNLFIFPRFTKMLLNQSEIEAAMVANHMSKVLLPGNAKFFITQVIENNHDHIDLLVNDFSLYKLKIFIANGETIYSTDQSDVGKINKHDYFHNDVANGKIYTKLVKKDTWSLEGQTVTVDVVETYVPIMVGDRFIGAVEIYFDITEQINSIRNAILYSNIFTLLFLVTFMIMCLIVARRLDDNIVERKNAQEFLKMTNLDLKSEIENRIKTEQEKEVVIVELEKTLSDLNTLKGLVPICSFCKNIRNDAGYWEQMEQYVEAHSDAEFSHGLCPDCAKEHYPDLHLDEDDESYSKRLDDQEEPTEKNSSGKKE